MAARHPDHRAVRHQGPVLHLRPPTGRPRRAGPAGAGGPLLARVRAGGQGRHHLGHGDEPPIRRDRAAHPDELGKSRRLGLRLRATGGRGAVVGTGHRPGLSHDHVRFHPRRGVPPGHRSHHRSVPAHRDRRTARRRRPHRLVAGRTTPLRRTGEQAARPGPAGRGASPRLPDQPGRTPQSGSCRSRWDSPPTTNSAPTTCSCGANSSSPAPTGKCRRWDWRPSTTRSPRRNCSAASTWTWSGCRRAASRPDLVLGPRVADHGWGLGYMLNQRRVNGPNPRIFGHGGLGGSFGFVDLEHRIGYAYVANRFDATKANADPRSLALSNEVYAALGVLSELAETPAFRQGVFCWRLPSGGPSPGPPRSRSSSQPPRSSWYRPVGSRRGTPPVPVLPQPGSQNSPGHHCGKGPGWLGVDRDTHTQPHPKQRSWRKSLQQNVEYFSQGTLPNYPHRN